MALLNLNALLIDRSVQTQPRLRAQVVFANRKNLAHLFSDFHLTVTQANPLEADAFGIFAPCHLIEGTYHVVLSTESGRPHTGLDVTVSEATSGAGGSGSGGGSGGGGSATPDLGVDYRYRFTDLAAFTANTSLSYAPGSGRVQVAAGDAIKLIDTAQTYEVAPPGASDAQIATDGGVGFYINQNRFDIKAEAWGVKMTGQDADAPANAEKMQTAVDWLSAQGGGCITLANDGHMKIDHAIRLRPGVIIDGAGAMTDNILVRQGAGVDRFGQDSTYLTGGFAKTDHDEHVWYRLEAVTSGADIVTLSNVANADQFELDDIVWIVEARDTWGDGAPAEPALSEVARVVGKSGNVLELECHNTLPRDVPAGAGTIAVNPTGAWIANVDWRVAGNKYGGDWPDTRYILKDATLVNHRLMQSGQDGTENTAIFGTRSGVYNCHVENISAHGMVANLMFGNGYVNSRYHNIRGPYIRRAIELKYLSQGSTFSDIRAWKFNHGFAADFDEDTPISIGESSRCVILDAPRVDVGNWQDDGSGLNLINFAGALSCDVRGPHITGKAPFASAISFPAAEGCVVEGGMITVPTSVTIEDSGINCSVRGVHFKGPVSTAAYRRGGKARGGMIVSNIWSHEGSVKARAVTGTGDRSVYLANNCGLSGIDNAVGRRILATGNLSDAWEEVLCSGANDNDLLGDSTSSTSAVVLGDAITLPAGTLAAGDILEWAVSGECSGAAGTRSLSWRAAIDTDGNGAALDDTDDINSAGTIELPASCSDWVLKARALMTLATRIVTQFDVTCLTTGNSLGTVTRHTDTDYANADVILSLSGWLEDGNDVLIVRSIERSAKRPGFLS